MSVFIKILELLVLSLLSHFLDKKLAKLHAKLDRRLDRIVDLQNQLKEIEDINHGSIKLKTETHETEQE